MSQSQNWLEETNITPFSFSQETLLGLESVGLSMRVPLGQMADLTEGEAKVL